MFHLDLKLLRSFAAVAVEGSVTRAAQRLCLTQPTVSGQLKELELALGFALFHRTTRRMELSERGAHLLPRVERLLAEAEELRIEVEEMQAAKVRRFRLGGAMYTLDLADRAALLDAFEQAHPDLAYSIDNRLQSAQIPDLMSGRLDAALLLGIPGGEPSTSDLDAAGRGLIVNEIVYPDGLERVVLRRRPIGLLVPAESPLARHESIPRAALAGERIAMISLEHGHAVVDPILALLEQAGAKALMPSEGNALAIERHAARHRMAAIGIGWFPSPEGMVLRPVDGMAFHLDLALVLGRAPNRAARRLFEFAARWQAQREAEPEQAAA